MTPAPSHLPPQAPAALGLTGRWQAWLRPLRALRAIAGVVKGGHGHWRSARLHRPVDATGAPLPWFTYPAIEFLAQFDLSALRVFEYGAGNSTLYWSARCAEVVSVESDPAWHQYLVAQLAPNVRLALVPSPAAYVACLEQEALFDVIVVDGLERLACCREAPARLKPGGLIILDNADWHPGAAAVLRQAGLLQVDMQGFGPVNGYSWTTSLFFHRAFDFPSRGGVRPQPGIGSIRRVVD
jgi:hypothetical protein